MHQINDIDTQEGREMAWHRKTVINPELSLENSRMNTWEFVPAELSVATPNGPQVTEFKTLTLSDIPGRVVGIPYADSYTPFLNSQIIECLKDAFAGSSAQLVSCGTIQSRTKRFFSFKLNELREFQVGKRSFMPYFDLLDAVDKSMLLNACTSNTCVVCGNTFAAAMRGGKEVSLKLRHTKFAALKLDGLAEAINAAAGAQAEFRAKFSQLMEQPANERDAKNFFAGMLSQGKEGVATRTLNQVERLSELFLNGAGNEGNSRADIFSAATDYYSHESAGENRWKQFISSDFGAGSRMKQQAFALLGNEESYNNTIRAGSAVLAKS